jgi:hypothetical protein
MKLLEGKELLNAINESVIEKIDAVILRECKDYGVIGTETQIKHLGGYIFAVSHTKIKTSKMHRYNLFCFSEMGFTLLYQDGNTIDGDKYKTIEQAIQQTKNFFTHHSNKLNNI